MGLLFIVIANFFWATELILVKKFFPTQNTFIVSALTCIIASFFYIPTFIVYKQKTKIYFPRMDCSFYSWFYFLVFSTAFLCNRNSKKSKRHFCNPCYINHAFLCIAYEYNFFKRNVNNKSNN